MINETFLIVYELIRNDKQTQNLFQKKIIQAISKINSEIYVKKERTNKNGKSYLILS